MASRIDALCVCIPMSFSSLVFCNLLLCRPDSFEKRYAAFGAQDDFSYTLKIHPELTVLSSIRLPMSLSLSTRLVTSAFLHRLPGFSISPQCLFSVPFAISSRIVFTVRPTSLIEYPYAGSRRSVCARRGSLPRTLTRHLVPR